MTAEQFIYWTKGYLTSMTDCQTKADIEKAIKEVDNKPTNSILVRGNATSVTTTLGDRRDITYNVEPKTLTSETVF